MYHIAIIGAGQLGSRHLQGIKLAASPLSITVMDNNDEALKVAKDRYDVVTPIGEKSISYVTRIEDLPSQLDLVIIATGSKPRASIIKSLLAHSTVRYLVLEKVLFPVLAEYQEIAEVLNAKQVKCWINCPRRMYGLYIQLKEIIDSETPMKMVYANENWGLCCNAIHMIDIFMYFTGEKEYAIDISKLNDKIEDSKRDGYIEMTGTILVKTAHGHKLSLTSENNYSGLKNMTIQNGNNLIEIEESKGVWSINSVRHQYKMAFQSQLTGLLADEILITGGCLLTPFDLSVSYHKPFIEALLEKYNELKGDNNNKVLPIT